MHSVVTRGWRGVVAGLGLLGLGGCGVVLAVLFITQGPHDAAPVAGVMGVVLGLPGLAIALSGWARRGGKASGWEGYGGSGGAGAGEPRGLGPRSMASRGFSAVAG
jgi:hypothetical protein